MIDIDWMTAMRMATAGAAAAGVVILNRRAAISPVTVYWTAFALALFCASLEVVAGGALGPAAPLVALGAAAACGWSWLFSRALFQARPAFERWPLVLVLTLVASAYIGDMGEIFGVAALAEGAPTRHVVDNLTRMISSTVLLAPVIEALRRYSARLSAPERRMRLMFVAVYSGLVAVTALWMRGAAEGSLAARYETAVLSVAPLIALILSAAALAYRLGAPLSAAAGSRPAIGVADAAAVTRARPQSKARPISPDPALAALAETIVRRLERDDYFTTPNLKVADLAADLGEPEYRVSKAVAATAHANFNRLVNGFRIERAKRLLRDPDHARTPILTIALDCGFGSVGPFNRAFKDATGQTPRAFRAGEGGARPAGEFEAQA